MYLSKRHGFLLVTAVLGVEVVQVSCHAMVCPYARGRAGRCQSLSNQIEFCPRFLSAWQSYFRREPSQVVDAQPVSIQLQPIVQTLLIPVSSCPTEASRSKMASPGPPVSAQTSWMDRKPFFG